MPPVVGLMNNNCVNPAQMRTYDYAGIRQGGSLRLSAVQVVSVDVVLLNPLCSVDTLGAIAMF